MFITKRHLSRRTLLRGMGTSLALPLLDAMIPAATAWAQTAAAPVPRLVSVFCAHGWAPTYWHDGFDVGQAPTPGRNVGLGFIHTPLAAYQDRLSIFAGLDATSSMPAPGDSGGDHARSAATLTGARPKKTSGTDILCGTSIDQIVAQHHGQQTLLPSLQLALEDPGSNTGVCGWGHSCAYVNSVSWASPTQPLPHEVNPAVVFERLFGDGGSPEERAHRRNTRASILDYVTGSVADLKRNLPVADRRTLDSYLENVREVERRVKISASRSAEAPDMEVPFGPPQATGDAIRLMWDLQVLAFQADITRISSLLHTRDESVITYPESGVTTSHHAASHHGGDPKRLEEYARLNRYHMETLAYFLKRLRETPDGNSNLFENSLVFWGSNMGNPNEHDHINVGHMLVGGAAGRHHPKKLNYIEKGPTSNLLLAVLHLYGIEQGSIGDSTRPASLS